MAVKVYYQIRQKSTGLMSRGGVVPKFTRRGKIWACAGDLKRHIDDTAAGSKKYDDDCEVVYLEQVPVCSSSVDEFTRSFKAARNG